MKKIKIISVAILTMTLSLTSIFNSPRVQEDISNIFNAHKVQKREINQTVSEIQRNFNELKKTQYFNLFKQTLDKSLGENINYSMFSNSNELRLHVANSFKKRGIGGATPADIAKYEKAQQYLKLANYFFSGVDKINTTPALRRNVDMAAYGPGKILGIPRFTYRVYYSYIDDNGNIINTSSDVGKSSIDSNFPVALGNQDKKSKYGIGVFVSPATPVKVKIICKGFHTTPITPNIDGFLSGIPHSGTGTGPTWASDPAAQSQFITRVAPNDTTGERSLTYRIHAKGTIGDPTIYSEYSYYDSAKQQTIESRYGDYYVKNTKNDITDFYAKYQSYILAISIAVGICLMWVGTVVGAGIALAVSSLRAAAAIAEIESEAADVATTAALAAEGVTESTSSTSSLSLRTGNFVRGALDEIIDFGIVHETGMTGGVIERGNSLGLWIREALDSIYKLPVNARGFWFNLFQNKSASELAYFWSAFSASGAQTDPAVWESLFGTPIFPNPF